MKRGCAGVKRALPGVPLAFRGKGQPRLVCVTPKDGLMASEWTLLEGGGQLSHEGWYGPDLGGQQGPERVLGGFRALGQPCLRSLGTFLGASQPGNRDVYFTVSLISSPSQISETLLANGRGTGHWGGSISSANPAPALRTGR